MTQIRCYETTVRPVFITVVLYRRIPYLKNLVGQVAPQALPDAYETTPKWHCFLMIKLAALAAGLNSEPQPATSSVESIIE